MARNDPASQQSHPSGVFFLLALPLYITAVNTSARISLSLFGWTLYYARQHCLSHCMNFLGKCFYSSGKHPSICCAPTTAHEGGKFTGEYMLNNSCPFPFAGDGVLVASISQEKQSLIQLCKTDTQHDLQDFPTSCAKLLWVLPKPQATLITVQSLWDVTNSCMYASSFP